MVMHRYLHAHVRSCTGTFIHKYSHGQVSSCISTFMQMYIHAHVRSCTSLFMHWYVCRYVHAEVRANMGMVRSYRGTFTQRHVNVKVLSCICTFMQTDVHARGLSCTGTFLHNSRSFKIQSILKISLRSVTVTDRDPYRSVSV